MPSPATCGWRLRLGLLYALGRAALAAQPPLATACAQAGDASSSRQVEMAVQQLLEMGDADAPPPTDAMLAGNIDSDEELAMALFRQFAEEMGPVPGMPEDVKNDPVRYEAYVREHFERARRPHRCECTASAPRVHRECTVWPPRCACHYTHAMPNTSRRAAHACTQ